jgi:hypothetical protein
MSSPTGHPRRDRVRSKSSRTVEIENTNHLVLGDAANNVANRIRRIREECDVPESATRSLARMMTRDVFEQRLAEMIQRIDAKDARRAIRGTEFFSIDENVMGSEFMRAYENMLLTGYIRGWLTATEAVGGKRRKQ